METLCPPGYHRNGFVATHALGNMMYGLMVYGLMYGLRYSSIKQKLFFQKYFGYFLYQSIINNLYQFFSENTKSGNTNSISFQQYTR